MLEYVLGRRVPHRELASVLGISERKFATRHRMADFPNAEECRLLGEHCGINPLLLQVTFGLITREGVSDYVNTAHFSGGRRTLSMTAIPMTERRRPEPHAGMVRYDPDAPPP